MKDKQGEDPAGTDGRKAQQDGRAHVQRDEMHEEANADAELRDVASRFVGNLLVRAREAAQRRQPRILEEEEEEEEQVPRQIPRLCPAQSPPEIQIDLVGSRTPSPEEVASYVAPRSEYKKKRVFIQESEDVPGSGCDHVTVADPRDDPRVREFALAYIKGIVERATALAQERAPAKAEEPIPEPGALKKAAGPWYSRIRVAVVRCLRTGCFCVVRRHSPA